MELVISPAALDDIRSIGKYSTRKWSEKQADIYVAKIYSGFEFIQGNPTHHSLRRVPVCGCCFLRVESHLIFFRDSETSVEIVRILHSSMDFERHLPS